MEGSESEAVFDAFDLNPHHFINEALNAADYLLDDAFRFCNSSQHRQASIITGCGEKQSDELAKIFLQALIYSWSSNYPEEDVVVNMQ